MLFVISDSRDPAWLGQPSPGLVKEISQGLAPIIPGSGRGDACHWLSQLISQTSHMTPSNRKGDRKYIPTMASEGGEQKYLSNTAVATTNVQPELSRRDLNREVVLPDVWY